MRNNHFRPFSTLYGKYMSMDPISVSLKWPILTFSSLFKNSISALICIKNNKFKGLTNPNIESNTIPKLQNNQIQQVVRRSASDRKNIISINDRSGADMLANPCLLLVATMPPGGPQGYGFPCRVKWWCLIDTEKYNKYNKIIQNKYKVNTNKLQNKSPP